jgi:hypothetical protein
MQNWNLNPIDRQRRRSMKRPEEHSGQPFEQSVIKPGRSRRSKAVSRQEKREMDEYLRAGGADECRNLPTAVVILVHKSNNDDAIQRVAYQPVVPVVGLSSLEIDEACQKLQGAWDNVFVAGPQHIEILRSLIGQAVAFASLRHPTLKDFNRQLSDRTKSFESIPSIRWRQG